MIITSVANLNTNTRLNFRMNIIDVHAHIGEHRGTAYTKTMLDTFVKEPLPNKDIVEKMIVSDMDTFHGDRGVNEYEGNKKALQMFNGDNRYSLIAGCSPNNGDVKLVEKVINDNPGSFVGLKFHPNDQHLPVTDSKYEPYFEFANRHKIPCLFHTHVPVDNGNGGILYRLADGTLDKTKLDPYSDPELIYQAARKYKDTPFIMAHLGASWNESHDRAIDILIESIRKGDANLYADISWVDIDAKPLVDGRSPKDHIVKAIKRLKGIGDSSWNKGDQSFRLMFGTDAPIARFSKEHARDKYSKFVEEIKAAIRSDKDLKADAEKIIQDLFYNNAKKLFFPGGTSNSTSTAAKSGGKTGKVAAIVLGSLALLGGGVALVKNKNKKESA